MNQEDGTPNTIRLKLMIELVPESAWGNNLRTILRKSVWEKLRKSIYAAYGNRCGICGATGRLNCHEVWAYDDRNHIQTLRGFIALCEWCHHVKHIGLTQLLAEQGKIDFERVVQHFMTVNDCDRETFEEHRRVAFHVFHERSRHEWRINYGQYTSLVEQGRRLDVAE